MSRANVQCKECVYDIKLRLNKQQRYIYKNKKLCSLSYDYTFNKQPRRYVNKKKRDESVSHFWYTFGWNVNHQSRLNLFITIVTRKKKVKHHDHTNVCIAIKKRGENHVFRPRRDARLLAWRGKKEEEDIVKRARARARESEASAEKWKSIVARSEFRSPPLLRCCFFPPLVYTPTVRQSIFTFPPRVKERERERERDKEKTASCAPGIIYGKKMESALVPPKLTIFIYRAGTSALRA